MTDKYDNDKDPKKDNPENHSDEQNDHDGHDPDRRKFIKNTGMVAGGVVGGSLIGGFLTNQFTSTSNKEPGTQSKNENTADYQKARQFFHRLEDFVVLETATERIFPKDDLGPGAIELGVPYFIDNQLAGRWGNNGKDYRHSPFSERKQKGLNPEAHADQSMLERGQIFLNGIRKMNDESKKRFDTTFDKTEEDQQIEVLQDFEDNKVKMNGVAAEDFFALLRQATLEGAYADPLYGGNKNMAGWKMKEFPGSQPSYTNIIDSEEFQEIKPISLDQYQGH